MRPPCRAFQLEPLSLPLAACVLSAQAAGQPDASSLQPGARVVVLLPGRQLWEPAEVAEVDAAGQRVAAITLSDRQRRVLPLSDVALSAYAQDPYGSDGEGQRGSALDATESQGDGSDGSTGSGSDMDFDSDEDGEGDGEEGEGGGYGSAVFGRVSLAMAEAAGLLVQQALAGPQSDTTLFFSSEAHSRGIGSKVGASRHSCRALACCLAGEPWLGNTRCSTSGIGFGQGIGRPAVAWLAAQLFAHSPTEVPV